MECFNVNPCKPQTPFCCSRGPCTKKSCGHAAGDRRWGRWLGEKVAEEAAREGTSNGKSEQGGPPKHVGRDAGTLQWWGVRPGSVTGVESEESIKLPCTTAAGFYAQHDEAAASGVRAM